MDTSTHLVTIATSLQGPSYQMKGWSPLMRTPHLFDLQRVLDEVGVAVEHIHAGMRQRKGTTSIEGMRFESTVGWTLYRYPVVPDCTVGVLTPPKSDEGRCVGHCDAFYQDGRRAPTALELGRLLISLRTNIVRARSTH